MVVYAHSMQMYVNYSPDSLSIKHILVPTRTRSFFEFFTGITALTVAVPETCTLLQNRDTVNTNNF